MKDRFSFEDDISGILNVENPDILFLILIAFTETRMCTSLVNKQTCTKKYWICAINFLQAQKYSTKTDYSDEEARLFSTKAAQLPFNTSKRVAFTEGSADSVPPRADVALPCGPLLVEKEGALDCWVKVFHKPSAAG